MLMRRLGILAIPAFWLALGASPLLQGSDKDTKPAEGDALDLKEFDALPRICADALLPSEFIAEAREAARKENPANVARELARDVAETPP